MERALAVGLGGFLGSMLRFGLGSGLARLKNGWSFPIETLVINVLGCLAIGWLAGLAESREMFTPTARAFLFVGVLGGFTTFSAFGYETVQLLRWGHFAGAVASVALQVALGIGAVWTGAQLARVG